MDGILVAISISLIVFLSVSTLIIIRALMGDMAGGTRSKSSLVDLPVAGMLPSILLNLHRVHDWLAKVLEERGRTAWARGPWFSGMVYLCTSDPAVVKYVTSTRYRNFVRGTRFREITFDLVCSLLLGVDLGSLSADFPTVPFARAVSDAEEVIVVRFALPRAWWRLMRWLRIGPERKMAAAMRVVDEFIYQHIESKKAALCDVKNGQRRTSTTAGGSQVGEVHSPGAALDLLTGFLEQYEAAGEPKDGTLFESDMSLRDTMVEMVVAGWHTTGVSISWLYWLVATHPSAEARILDELASVVGADGGGGGRRRGPHAVFDADELHGCVYLDAVIHETLRLFAPLPLNPFCAVEKDVLPTGDVVEPGTTVLIDLYAVGRMKANWGADAREFRPERWLTEEGKQIREESPYKFSAFGSGPKACVGRRMGLSIVKAAAASVIYNFRFDVAEGHRALPSASMVLHMKNGLMGSLRLRERSPHQAN